MAHELWFSVGIFSTGHYTLSNHYTWSNSLKAADTGEIDLWQRKDKDLEHYFQSLNFHIVTTKKTYGPFGSSDLNQQKQISIPIENGDVLAQVTNYFIYSNEYDEPISFQNEKCFSFYVSLQY